MQILFRSIWTSKFGSLTFNQYGREIPMGGINEAGLVIHMMRLNATQYPEPDSRRVIHRLQWIQYQLDRYSTVEEVIGSDSQVRIYPYAGSTHYLVQDRSGNCASIEFLFGKMVYHTQASMPVKALTKSTYTDSINYLKRHKGFGGQKSISNSRDSLDRFTRAAVMLKKFKPEMEASVIDHAFDILKYTAQPNTQWSIVYDQKNLRAYFCTALNQKIRYVDLADFDFSCDSPVRVLNMNAQRSGNIAEYFKEYFWTLNHDLIREAYRKTTHLMGTGDNIIEWRAKYPDLMTACGQ